MKNNFSPALAALLSEYERAVRDLKSTVGPVSDRKLVEVADPLTPDEDCRSIQSVLSHVVRSGYGYAVYIQNHLGERLAFPERTYFGTAAEYVAALDEMMQYNLRAFAKYPDLALEEFEEQKKIRVRWGQAYDVEQLLEHAIVHILRHRRQIERFLK